MDDQSEHGALLTALTTEHFVLQTANNSTYAEASARSSLYVMALSSSVVAMGFAADSTDLLIPFAAISLPAVFFLGIFTIVRLVESALESRPEMEPPALRFGSAMAFFGTTASMIAAINNVVAGVGVALLTRSIVPSAPRWVSAVAGIASAAVLTWLFYRYQRWRFADYDIAARELSEAAGDAR